MAQDAGPVADDGVADDRLHTVAADAAVGFEASAVSRRHCHAVVAKLEAFDARRGVEADQRMLAHRVVAGLTRAD